MRVTSLSVLSLVAFGGPGQGNGHRPVTLVARTLGHGNSLPPWLSGLWPGRCQGEPGPGGEKLAQDAQEVLVVVGRRL